MPRVSATLPGHPLIQREARATRLNGWSRKVRGQSVLAICLHVTHRNSAALNEKREVTLSSELDSNSPLVGTSMVFTVVFRSHASNLE